VDPRGGGEVGDETAPAPEQPRVLDAGDRLADERAREVDLTHAPGI
jgi:hypothetical protein